MKKILFLCFALSIVTLLKAQTCTFETSVEGVKAYNLPNGLKILLIPDQSQSNVVVNIVYNVGSRHEGYGETGMAHLIEHMMFKRSSKFTDIKKAIADKGASANGTTWYDRTNYYEILPATDENLKWALDMEADRMVTSAILQSDLDKEFSVVRNEFEIGENNPSSILQERILSTAYLWHNYGKSTIGSKEDIERVPAVRLKKFYQKYYQPNNATLIVGGKFDEKQTLGWIEQYFASIPKPATVIEPTYTVEPPQDGERYVELRRNGDIQYIAMAYHTPCFSDKAYAANDALISILTNNPSGALYKALVNAKLASSVYGYAQTLKDPGFSYYACEVPKDKDLTLAQNAFLETMNKVPEMTFTEEDLTRAKNELTKNIENTYNKTVNFSVALTEFIGAGDWRLFFVYRDNVEKLTLADIQKTAKTYYLTTNRTWGKFIPDANSQRTSVPEVGDITALVNNYKGKVEDKSAGNFDPSVDNIVKIAEEGKLTSGGKFILLEKPAKGDKVEARLLIRMGNESSLSGKSLIASVTARMLKTGTKTQSKQQINDLLDKYKTNLYLYANVDGLFINLSTNKANLKNALDMLNDILRNPSFNAEEFEKVKLEMKAEFETYKSEPQMVANEKLLALTAKYPKTHPYYSNTTDENLAQLSTLKLEDVKEYFQKFYGGAATYSVFVGGVDKPAAKSFLENTFGNWTPQVVFKRIATQYFDVKSQSQTIQINDKTNAAVLGNLNLKIGENNPDYPAVDIANELLGGGAFLSSRIPQRLREAEGMSYGAGSWVSGSHFDPTGNWGVYAFFNPIFKGKMDNAIKEEIQKALDKGFSKEEFDSSLKSWLQSRQTNLSMDNFLAYQFREYLEQGKTFKDYTNYENKVKALDVNKVNAALKKYFDVNKFVLIYAGDFTKK
ncbi:MAG: pitrilysin family protein [Bacteroidota bacterium]|nr:pitrilysin family protein [Bacteroidota bacterium]